MSAPRLREGDVIRYQPDEPHCREGMATYERVGGGRLALLDSYWRNDRNEVTPNEYEVLFNFADVESVEAWQWQTHKVADRFVLTHQHGHQREHYVRAGSSQDRDTMVQSARDALAEAQEQVRWAQHRVEDRQRDLDRVLAGGNA